MFGLFSKHYLPFPEVEEKVKIVTLRKLCGLTFALSVDQVCYSSTSEKEQPGQCPQNLWKQFYVWPKPQKVYMRKFSSLKRIQLYC